MSGSRTPAVPTLTTTSGRGPAASRPANTVAARALPTPVTRTSRPETCATSSASAATTSTSMTAHASPRDTGGAVVRRTSDDGRVRRPTAPAPLLVLGAVASVQTGAAVAKDLFADVGPGGAVLLRLASAALLLLAVSRPRLGGRSRQDLGLAVVFGLVLTAMNVTFYYSLARIPLGVAVTIEFVGPLALAVAGSRRRLDLLWVVLAAAGVVLLTGGGGRIDMVGALLALIAGGFWAVYILLSQRVGRVFPGASGLALGLAAGTLALLPLALLPAGDRVVDASVLWRGAVIGVLSSALPYSLEMFALRRMRASVFSVLMSIEPAFAALSGLVFLGEHLNVREWIAIGCVVAASIGATRHAQPDDVPVDPGATPTELVVA